jgi:protein-S-isoprenylcysteine O-methyltransferase Ste14
VHNDVSFSFTNLLVGLVGLAVSYWMSRAPRSMLQLMNNRYPALELAKNQPWLTSVVRNFGRFSFFSLTLGLLLLVTPPSLANTPAFSLVSLLVATLLSVLALRKRKTAVPQ